MQQQIFDRFDEYFANPIISAVQYGQKLPKPTSYCKTGKYPLMLKRMNNAGLIGWRLEHVNKTKLSNYASELQVTNFAITKILDEVRLITWPRLANEFTKEPEPPDLPDPSLFQYLRAGDEKLTGVYCDISNMFHSLPLPSPFIDLFPLPPVRFGDLDADTKIAC